jgi:nucleoside-diphosphate-sugar epimerase
MLRKWNLWGYVDARDVAQSCRLGLEADVRGAEAFIIAAADTVMDRPNEELMAEVFPDVPLRDGTGDFDTLLSIDKARDLLGYAPGYSWRNHL